MKSKVKYVVSDDFGAIGAFELRPVYSGSIVYKIIVRISQKFLRFSILPAKYIEIWAQIAQTEPIRLDQEGKLDTGSEKIDLGLEDRRRLKSVEDTSRKLMVNMGLKELKSSLDPSLHQAFHPSGNILLGSDPSIYAFDTNLKSNYFCNLYIAGASGFKNGSWVNPTFTILLHSMNNARLSLKS
jgi:hypothetical protein